MKNEIDIKKWLKLKPYSTQTKTDYYYLRLCNTIKHMLRKPQYKVLKIYLGQKEINLFICFLVSYYEDIISGTNIWNTFVKTHYKLYKKRIPFFDTDDTNNNVNKQDVRFLVWYFLNTVQEEKFINPYNDFLLNIANTVGDLFEKMSGSAPINLVLKSYYNLKPEIADYYIVRNFIDNVLFRTYLFYPDTGLKISQVEREIYKDRIAEESFEPIKDFEKVLPYLQENRDDFISKKCTRLLSLKGKEWAAEILGENHSLYNDIKNISQRISGFFLFRSADKHHAIIEHIASGREFNLIKEFYEQYNDLIKSDLIVYIGIVKWKDSWWFSGITFNREFDADLILDEKNSLEHRRQVAFLDFETDEMISLLDEQRKNFLSFNNNSSIAFMPSAKINSFMKDFISYHNARIHISEEEENDAIERLRKDGIIDNEAKIELDFSEDGGTALMFFNPKSGVEIVLNINSAFPTKENPFFVKEESYEDVLHLLVSDQCSTELAMYCIDNYKTVLPFFTNDIGAKYLFDIDFLLRFWKTENYHTFPTLTITGKKEIK
ncbi:MAG: DUF3843 family protein [Bacteroidetes bacterium]|nr:DUF3843 family protein [Bacteroidota bacterium]MBU1113724.1 DUF3843 family protein [Bacteroidota bacterium]MBU1799376.1 DUF3843 family protein [Bacteroidota bacterium]